MKEASEDFLGVLAGHYARFPLLLKFLDVTKGLSVQVHPCDAHKELIPEGDTGKTEAWVVVEKGSDARIYAGLKPGTTANLLRQVIANKTVADQLAPFFPNVGDGVLIRAGTVHSLRDVVVFEVQENSDVTFRLYDWDHIDPETGQSRPLQVDQAMACINFDQGVIVPVTPQLRQAKPAPWEKLIGCDHFGVWRASSEFPFVVGAEGTCRVLVGIPDDPQVRMTRAQLALDESADLQPLQEALQQPIAKSTSLTRAADDPNYLLCLRSQAVAARALTNFRAEGSPAIGTIVPHSYWEGVVARWEKDPVRARAAFTAARALVAPVVAAQPQLASAVSLLGVIDAGLSRREEAVAEGTSAAALLPTSQDASDGPIIATRLAQIYAWTGNKQAAIDEIAEIEKKPNLLSYGILKLNPIWDDLRDEPRFEALLKSLAPKR